MQQPEIAVSYESNGVLELTCKVGFIGGCCFPLTSHDVTASLDLPAGISVLSGPEPARYAAIEAPPSGTPQAWATFRWRLRRSSPDAGKSFTVTVSGPGSGQVQATHTFDRQSRINIGGPRLPDRLAAGQALAIAVDAACLDPDRYVKRVRFWYSTEVPAGAEPVETPPDLAERGILQFKLAGQLRQVQGQSIDLARKYEPTVWHGTLPSPNIGSLYGVAIASDDTGKTASGPIVRCAATASTGMPNANPLRWVGIGVFLTVVVSVAFALLPRRDALAAAGVALLVAVAIGLVWIRQPSAAPMTDNPGYPVNASTVVYLFLDHGKESRQLAERMETYRRAAPHRIHLLCFVEGVTPAPILNAYRERLHVTRTPSVVFDNHALVDGADLTAIHGTLDRCFEKPTPRLSMELHGGMVAGHQLSLGFIMCNHASRKDAHGSVSAFAFENGVLVNGWRCDHVVRASILEGRRYAIPVGKCQAPAMMQWNVPSGVDPGQTGVLTMILDEQERLIDSICTERPCSRTGICG